MSVAVGTMPTAGRKTGREALVWSLLGGSVRSGLSWLAIYGGRSELLLRLRGPEELAVFAGWLARALKSCRIPGDSCAWSCNGVGLSLCLLSNSGVYGNYTLSCAGRILDVNDVTLQDILSWLEVVTRNNYDAAPRDERGLVQAVAAAATSGCWLEFSAAPGACLPQHASGRLHCDPADAAALGRLLLAGAALEADGNALTCGPLLFANRERSKLMVRCFPAGEPRRLFLENPTSGTRQIVVRLCPASLVLLAWQLAARCS